MSDQQQLPSWLKYGPSRNAIQAEVTFATLVEKTAGELHDKRRPMQSKEMAEKHLLPLIGVMMQYVTHQHADDIMYFQRTLLEAHRLAAEEQEPETIVGLEEGTADDLLAPLIEVQEWLEALAKRGEDDEKLALAIAGVEDHIAAINNVRATIEDLVLEDEDDEDDEDAPSDIEDEPPINITNDRIAAKPAPTEPPLVIT